MLLLDDLQFILHLQFFQAEFRKDFELKKLQTEREAELKIALSEKEKAQAAEEKAIADKNQMDEERQAAEKPMQEAEKRMQEAEKRKQETEKQLKLAADKASAEAKGPHRAVGKEKGPKGG